MVEWLSQRVMHRPFVNDGSHPAESTGPTFREQDEMNAKKKKREKKKDKNEGFYKTPKSVAFAQMRTEGKRHADRGLSKVR